MTGRQTNYPKKSLNFVVKSRLSTSVLGSTLESQPESRRQMIKRMIVIMALSTAVIWIGSGCYSLKNVREISLGFGGFDAEFYEPKAAE
jgi:hypothetical protein